MPLAQVRRWHTPGRRLRQLPAQARRWTPTGPKYERLLAVFKAHDVRWFLYNGGNDSADTALRSRSWRRNTAIR